MPRDLHGQDPMLGYSHGNDPTTGSTQIPLDVQRETGIKLCSLSIRAGLTFEETVDLIMMLGIKKAA